MVKFNAAARMYSLVNAFALYSLQIIKYCQTYNLREHELLHLNVFTVNTEKVW